jgi:membrane-associated phospholipid phosphatase
MTHAATTGPPASRDAVRWTRRPALIVALLALVVHVGLGLALDGDALLPGDKLAFDITQDLRFGAGVDVVRVLTDVGSLPVAVVIVAMTALHAARRLDRPDQALALVAGFALVFILVHVTKGLWDRPRPPGRLSDVVGTSYPSGHSAYATAYVACALVTRSRRLLVAALSIAIAVGLSRLYLHVHFLTDVVGGIALTTLVFAVLLRP